MAVSVFRCQYQKESTLVGPLEQIYPLPFRLMPETDLFSKTLKIFAWDDEQYPKQQSLQLQYANVRSIDSWIESEHFRKMQKYKSDPLSWKQVKVVHM